MPVDKKFGFGNPNRNKKRKWYWDKTKYDELKNRILQVVEYEALSLEEILEKLEMVDRYWLRKILKKMHGEGVINKYKINQFGKIVYIKNLNMWQM